MIVTSAAVVEAPGAPFTVRDIILDDTRPGEVLVRMIATGLCHTDLGVQAGGIPFPLPGVLGHEGAGVVEEVGAGVTDVTPGDHVVLSFTSCGQCAGCRGGHPAYCLSWVPRNLISGTRDDGSPTAMMNGTPIGGHFFGQSSFAAHALVDERSVVVVGRDAPLDILAPLGCGVQTGFGTVWNVLRPAPGSSLAVLGTGAVGLSAIMAANLLPLAAVVAVDRVPERLALARGLGATHTVNPTREDSRPAGRNHRWRARLLHRHPGRPRWFAPAWMRWRRKAPPRSSVRRRRGPRWPSRYRACCPASGSWVSPSATPTPARSCRTWSSCTGRAGCRSNCSSATTRSNSSTSPPRTCTTATP